MVRMGIAGEKMPNTSIVERGASLSASCRSGGAARGARPVQERRRASSPRASPALRRRLVERPAAAELSHKFRQDMARTVRQPKLNEMRISAARGPCRIVASIKEMARDAMLGSLQQESPVTMRRTSRVSRQSSSPPVRRARVPPPSCGGVAPEASTSLVSLTPDEAPSTSELGSTSEFPELQHSASELPSVSNMVAITEDAPVFLIHPHEASLPSLTVKLIMRSLEPEPVAVVSPEPAESSTPAIGLAPTLLTSRGQGTTKSKSGVVRSFSDASTSSLASTSAPWSGHPTPSASPTSSFPSFAESIDLRKMMSSSSTSLRQSSTAHSQSSHQQLCWPSQLATPALAHQ